jgi:NADPH:quinone reductase-like Zn-dependent oxidoreductase
MKAIVMQGDKKAILVHDRPEPKLRPDYILVETKAVALNPADFKNIDFMNTPNHLIGCDYAGVVLAIGPNPVKAFKKGDRICGFVHGGNSRQQEDGAHAEKIMARSGVTMKIPDSMSFEEAAPVGVAVMTCGQGLYQQMGLSWPNNPTKSEDFILIYGGSSAMGTMGIQLAKLSGYRVIATCSPHNFDLVKSYGAEAAFNYKDPEAVEQIKKYADNNLKFVWDTISLKPSAAFCSKVIASGGHYGQILPVDLPNRKDVKQTYSLGYTSVGVPFEMLGRQFGAEETQRDYEFIQKWMSLGEQLLAEKKLKPHPLKIGSGLESVLEGIDLLRNDKVSGQKLVYTVRS